MYKSKVWIKTLITENGLTDPEIPDPHDTPVYYVNGNDEIILHGSFTAKQLKTLVNYMKKYTKG